MKKLSLLILIVALIVYFSVILSVRSQNIPCGGFKGEICSGNLVCDYEDNYADARGKCVLPFDIIRFVK